MPDTPVMVAIVDDDESIRHALGNLLRAADFDVLAFASAEEFLDAFDGQRFGCVIADINLPGMSGVALLESITATGRMIPGVLITAGDDPATLTMIGRAGAVPHLRKPFSDEDLFAAMHRVMRH
jgi:FixJ family two-component response regulator